MSSTASNKSVLALADCNSFYCSCERLFAPRLEGKPVVVLSNNDGCVVSRTEEAKALGIPMGAPHFKIRDLVKRHGVHVFSSNYSLYGDISSRVMKTLSQFTPELEVYSIDEAFLNLTGFSPVEPYARQIRETVKKHAGIPVSIGIGPTKVLAKVANKIAKKRKEGVFDLTDPGLHDPVLSSTAVEDIWGIGSKSADKLHAAGIKTAKDLRDASDPVIQKLLTVVGRRIAAELRGEVCLDLELETEKRKEICCARGFGRPVCELEEIKEALANYVTWAAERLRKQKSVCGTVLVFLHTNPFKKISQYFNQVSSNLLTATSATNTLISVATKSLEKIFKPGFEYKRAGVILTNLTSDRIVELQLSGGEGLKNSHRVMKTVDGINEKMGRDTVRFGICGTRQDWKMLSKMRSPSYTTRWDQILAV